jgi:hypothetical protein
VFSSNPIPLPPCGTAPHGHPGVAGCPGLHRHRRSWSLNRRPTILAFDLAEYNCVSHHHRAASDPTFQITPTSLGDVACPMDRTLGRRRGSVLRGRLELLCSKAQSSIAVRFALLLDQWPVTGADLEPARVVFQNLLQSQEFLVLILSLETEGLCPDVVLDVLEEPIGRPH